MLSWASRGAVPAVAERPSAFHSESLLPGPDTQD